jgi:PadR family transcriptional regulator PadR
MRIEPRILILQSLLDGEERFGLEIGARITEVSGGRSGLPQGALYPALRQLEREGLVTSRTGETVAARQGRPRVYYKLTAEGERAAREDQKAAQGIFGLTGAEPAWRMA